MKKLLLFLSFVLALTCDCWSQTFPNVDSVKKFIEDSIRPNSQLKATTIKKAYQGEAKFLPDAVQDTSDVVVKAHGMHRFQRKDFTEYVYDTIGGKRWRNAAGSSLVNNQEARNLKSDTVTFVRFNTAVLSNAQSPAWTRGAAYTANSTETVVANGLQVVNTLTGGLSSSYVYDGAWESSANNTTAMFEIKITSFGTNGRIGITFYGATDFVGVSYSNHVFVNLTTSDVTILTFSGSHSVGTLSNTIAPGDSVRLYFNRNFNTYTARIYNLSKNTDESFSWNDNGSMTAAPTNIYPGYYLQNGAFIIRKHIYYANNFRPKLLVSGSSLSANVVGMTGGYGKSLWGRVDSISGWRIENTGKVFNNIADQRAAAKENIAMKPDGVLIEMGYNDQRLGGATPSVWGPSARALVDTFLKAGIPVIVQKLIPTNSNVPAVVNAWVDSTFRNDPDVRILDFYKTTALYNADSANFQNRSFYTSDQIHENEAGGNELAQYAKTQLQKLLHFNVSGGVDVATINRNIDNQILSFRNTGVNQGEWRPQPLWDTCTLATFGAGARLPGDTAAFTDSTLYGSFFEPNDTLVITKLIIVMQGTSDTLDIKIAFNDTINVDGTKLKNTATPCNNNYTGTVVTSFDNNKIPPGNWVWCKSPAVVPGRRPTYLSVSLIGYKSRRL